jgi:hypothetical protein
LFGSPEPSVNCGLMLSDNATDPVCTSWSGPKVRVPAVTSWPLEPVFVTRICQVFLRPGHPVAFS